MEKPGFLITARLKSKRLPKKIVLEVAGKPLLVHMLDRIKQAKKIGKIVICTSTNPQDDPLEQIAFQEEVICFRGSEEDVLARLLEAAKRHEVSHFINLTADCPLIDPDFIDRTVDALLETGADFVKFDKLPRGQGMNGVKVSSLKKVCDMKMETETEVWGDYFMDSPDMKVHYPYVAREYIHETLKTSIDYPEDYQFIKEVFAALYRAQHPLFGLSDILRLVRTQPHLIDINKHCIALGKTHIATTAAKPRLNS